MSQLSTGASDHEKPAPSGGGSWTIEEFCERNRISRSFFYKMRAQGIGPDEMHTGATVRITQRAEFDWQRRGEQRAKEAAKEAVA
jgi:hypothetical protein